jgi:RNA polymerase sigma factor (sigma-70 family)
MADIDEGFRDLMRRFSAGDEDAAREVVARFGDDARRAVRRILKKNSPLRRQFDSSDIEQMLWDALLALARQDKTEQFRDPEALAAFLSGTARHKVADAFRRDNSQKRGGGRGPSPIASDDADARQISDLGPSALDVLIGSEEWDRVLESHPPQHRQLLRLFLEGCNYEEIRKKLGFSTGHVARTVAEMYEELRARLKGRKE